MLYVIKLKTYLWPTNDKQTTWIDMNNSVFIQISCWDDILYHFVSNLATQLI